MKNIGIYLNVDFERSFKSNDAVVKMSLYKGHVVLKVVSTTKRARALAEHAGVCEAGVAWLEGPDLDRVIALLRDAQTAWRLHRDDIRKVAACEKCRERFAGVCDRHRVLFKKYKRPRHTRGLR